MGLMDDLRASFAEAKHARDGEVPPDAINNEVDVAETDTASPAAPRSYLREIEKEFSAPRIDDRDGKRRAMWNAFVNSRER
jgi:hypothetical protein